MKQLILCILICSALLGCSSPLNEIEITQPEIIMVTAEVIHEIGGDQRNEYRLTTQDRSGAYINLNGGAVDVNGVGMSHGGRDIIKYNYVTYNQNLAYQLNTAYAFTVMLADGETYTSTVTTQAIGPPVFEIVTLGSTSDTLFVILDESTIDPAGVTTATLNYTSPTNAYTSIVLNHDDSNPYSYQVSPEALQGFMADGGTLTITVKNSKAGSINGSFRNGSAIYASQITHQSKSLAGVR